MTPEGNRPSHGFFTGALISAGVDVDLVTADPRAWLSDN